MRDTRGEGAVLWLVLVWLAMMAALAACGVYGLLVAR